MKKYDDIMLKTAILWAERSKCKKRKVGAVIAKDGRIISVGYNGLPSRYKILVDAQKCALCEGSGTVNIKGKDEKDSFGVCPKCGGTGWIKEYKDICEDEYKACPECGSTDISKFDDIDYICNKCSRMFGEPRTVYTTRHEYVIHAEANAILFAAKNGIPTQDCTLYVTTAPCSECAKMIIQSGIKRVVYMDEYDNGSRKDGLELLKAVGVEVEKIG